MSGTRIDYLVLGSGPAGTRASETIRKRDREAHVVVVSADRYPFYNRILLSKDFLKDDALAPEQVVLKPTAIWERQGIELMSGQPVARLDPGRREAILDSGRTLLYERCLIATGAIPLRLPVAGADDNRVHILRTLEDAVRLRRAAREASRAVVIGGGLIGVEVAAALAARGVPCTVIEREAWLFGLMAPPAVGRVIEQILADGGVTVVTGAAVIGIREEAAKLTVLSRPTDSGNSGPVEHEADLVVVGVGVRPSTRFVEGIELSRDGGIVVNERLQAAPGLWAAGDVATFPDPRAGIHQRIEHWLHAQHQGRVAGVSMTGGEDRFEDLTSYDTELFGTAVKVYGSPGVAERWSGETESVVWGYRGSVPVAAYLIGETELDIDDIKRSMKYHGSPTPG